MTKPRSWPRQLEPYRCAVLDYVQKIQAQIADAHHFIANRNQVAITVVLNLIDALAARVECAMLRAELEYNGTRWPKNICFYRDETLRYARAIQHELTVARMFVTHSNWVALRAALHQIDALACKTEILMIQAGKEGEENDYEQPIVIATRG